MSRAIQKDWGFDDITAKFGRDVRPRRKVADKPARRVAIRSRGMMHVGFWLTAVALCLLGLVALNVGILEKNMEYNGLIEEKNSLAAENSRLSSEVASLRSPARIEQIATGPLGMVAPKTVEYVYIGPSGSRQDYAQLDPPESAGGRKLAAP